MNTVSSEIRVECRSVPTYCSICEAPYALHVALQHPKVAGPITFALCDDHASRLASRLLYLVRTTRPPQPTAASSSPRETERPE